LVARDEKSPPESMVLLYQCEEIYNELFHGIFDDEEMKSIWNRNEQIAQRIYELLTQKPNTKFLFAVSLGTLLRYF
jgi:uncharacterized membrane protein